MQTLLHILEFHPYTFIESLLNLACLVPYPDFATIKQTCAYWYVGML